MIIFIKMRKLLSTTFVGLVLLTVCFFLIRFTLELITPTNGFLTISSSLPKSKISLDSKEVGTSPYQGENLKVGTYKLKLEGKFATSSSKFFGGRSVSWSNQINLGSNALTVVNIDFGPKDPFNAVEILSLRKGTTSLSLATQPTGAKVEVDGTKFGESPLAKEVRSGVHRITLSKDGYLTRQLDINVPEGYQTIIQVTLAANPLPKTNGKLSAKAALTFYDLSSNLSALLEKPSLWAEGVWFFQEKTTSLETTFDALIDFNGKAYYYDETAFKAKLNSNLAINVGYLGKISAKGLSPEAQKAWDSLVPTPKITQVEVLPTPTGVLNVRDGPSQNNRVLLTVKPGEKYELTAEQSGWYKIKVGSTEGWVSSQYAKKI